MRIGMVWATLGCLAALLIAGGAIAQVETTPVPPNPKPDFSSMSFFEGTWNCTESNTRRPRPYTYTSTYTMDSTGYWMDNKTANHPTAWFPRASTAVTRQTYDKSTGRWVTLTTDDQGNYDFSSSKGWKGNTIVWHDESYPKTNNTATSGDTYVTKQSPTKTTYTYSFTEPSGRNVKVKGTCIKS